MYKNLIYATVEEVIPTLKRHQVQSEIMDNTIILVRRCSNTYYFKFALMHDLTRNIVEYASTILSNAYKDRMWCMFFMIRF